MCDFTKWVIEGARLMWGWLCIISRLSSGKSAEEEHGMSTNPKEDKCKSQ